jgi:integrase
MRASEISKLCLGDVYSEQGNVRDRLHVSGGRSERVLPLKSIKLRIVLANHYERSFGDGYFDAMRPLIYSQRHGAMTPAALARLMTAAYRAAGIDSGTSRSGRRTLRARFELLDLSDRPLGE